ncbi:hypothetical protein IWQ61_009327 [Dispira simplex]|nr:hypothetical protein IWQ61_009327 [Dispira simplex]
MKVNAVYFAILAVAALSTGVLASPTSYPNIQGQQSPLPNVNNGFQPETAGTQGGPVDVNGTPLPPVKNYNVNGAVQSQNADAQSVPAVASGTPLPPVENPNVDGVPTATSTLLEGLPTSEPVPNPPNGDISSKGPLAAAEEPAVDGQPKKVANPAVVDEGEETPYGAPTLVGGSEPTQPAEDEEE